MFCGKSSQGNGSVDSPCALSRITNVSETSRLRLTMVGSETGLMRVYDIKFPGGVYAAEVDRYWQ